jgi:hypothetical protein
MSTLMAPIPALAPPPAPAADINLSKPAADAVKEEELKRKHRTNK